MYFFSKKNCHVKFPFKFFSKVVNKGNFLKSKIYLSKTFWKYLFQDFNIYSNYNDEFFLPFCFNLCSSVNKIKMSHENKCLWCKKIRTVYWNNNRLFSAIGLPPSMILPCRPNVCSLCNFSKTPFPEWQPILLPNWLISIQLTWGITISKGSLRRVSEKQFMVSYYLHIFFSQT